MIVASSWAPRTSKAQAWPRAASHASAAGRSTRIPCCITKPLTVVGRKTEISLPAFDVSPQAAIRTGPIRMGTAEAYYVPLCTQP
jgi:hypothetical protein